MTISAVKKYDGQLYGSQPANSTTTLYLDGDPVQAKIKITSALALGIGLVHVVFSMLHVGAVTKYLSDSIVSGFTCGASYQIFISQIPSLLGISTVDIHTPFVITGVSEVFDFYKFSLLAILVLASITLFYFYLFFVVKKNIVEIFKKITTTNLAILIISIVTIGFLYLAKTQINDRFKDKLPAPVPIELIVVIYFFYCVYTKKLLFLFVGGHSFCIHKYILCLEGFNFICKSTYKPFIHMKED